MSGSMDEIMARIIARPMAGSMAVMEERIKRLERYMEMERTASTEDIVVMDGVLARLDKLEKGDGTQ